MTVQRIKTETSSLPLARTVDLHLFLACCCAEFIINLASGSLRATRFKKWKVEIRGKLFHQIEYHSYLLRKNVKISISLSIKPYVFYQCYKSFFNVLSLIPVLI